MIKKIVILLLIIIFLLLPLSLFSKNIVIKNIPSTIDDFLELRNSIAKTPEGGAVIMILALLIFSENEELGKKCLTLAISLDFLTQGNYYKGYKPRESDMSLIISQLKKQPYIAKSYIKGATPENNYTIPKGNIKFNFYTTKYSGDMGSGLYKVFVECSGASDRPITLKVNDKGLWKAFNWSSLIVGIRSPEIIKDDL